MSDHFNYSKEIKFTEDTRKPYFIILEWYLTFVKQSLNKSSMVPKSQLFQYVHLTPFRGEIYLAAVSSPS